MTKEKKIDNSEDVADVIEDEDPNEEGEDQTESPGEEELDEPVSPPPSDSNHVILIEDDEDPGTNEESSNTVASGTGVAVAALIRQLLLNSATDPVVRWEDQQRGEFRVLNPGLLARRIQQANPSRPISDLRCDRGVFESVPGKQLVFRFGDLEPHQTSLPKAASPTNVILTPKQISPAPELSSKKLPIPHSRRKTYAQKISDLQKPIPGQTVDVPILKRVMPKEASLASLSLRIPNQAASQSPSMPSLIPLTIDDMAKKEAAAAAAAANSSKGLHLSGGGFRISPETLWTLYCPLS